MNGQQIVKCTQCESNRVQVFPLVLAIFVSAGVLIWIPIIGWIGAPILFLLGIGLMFMKGKMFKCNECKHTFMVDKSTYKEYKQKLYSKAK